MTARRIVALPVDGRPVVREQVQMLAACAGWQLDMPEVAHLGHLKRPADRDALHQWITRQASQADGFVLSLDMLAYGGLVPSRIITDTLDQLRGYLSLLPELRAQFPGKPIYAFAATMRMSNNNVNEEEKTYWSEYGELIWRWSYLTDKGDLEGAAQAQLAIPQEIRDDYLATRQRNFTLTLETLDMVATGTIDRLVLPQDDTAEYGFNIAERRQLEQRIIELGLQDRVLVYPGADEVMHTLCAHMASTLSNEKPLSFYLHCSDPLHVGQLRALYEDRPILQAVSSQLSAVGARLAATPEEADIILAVHTSGTQQGDWAMRKPLPQQEALPPGWLEALAAWQAEGKPVAVADLAYANGGDPAMMGELARALPLQGLAAYAGWNTASNSLGSLIAQCVFAHGSYNQPANRQVVTLRLLEDLVYQSILRQIIRSSIVEAECTPQSLLAAVEEVVYSHANAWSAAHQLGWEISDIYLPWDRTFEIGLRLQPAGGAA